MWLIDVQYLTLKEFNSEESRPPYAILSHTWGEEEITHQQLLQHEWTAPNAAVPETIPLSYHSRNIIQGWKKIVQTCVQADGDGLRWAWVDTCCIDKKSSAELSEAINSMYRWYREAHICYVYLADVDAAESITESRWFTRGWALQELIAPSNLRFFNRDWNLLGNRTDLAAQIHERTAIDASLLRGEGELQLSKYSIAQRMSWAAGRQTTRIEDRAYSLLGIFDVNMPLLYGERSKAFVRLQEEIIKTSVDQSIFVWTRTGENSNNTRSLLAPDADCFARCSSITALRQSDAQLESYELNNLGLRLKAILWKDRYAVLTCGRGERWYSPMALEIEPAESFNGAFNCTSSTVSDLPGFAERRGVEKTVTILRNASPTQWPTPTPNRPPGTMAVRLERFQRFTRIESGAPYHAVFTRMESYPGSEPGSATVEGQSVAQPEFLVPPGQIQVIGFRIRVEYRSLPESAVMDSSQRLNSTCDVIVVVDRRSSSRRARAMTLPAEGSLCDVCAKSLVAWDNLSGAWSRSPRLKLRNTRPEHFCANLIFKTMARLQIIDVDISLEGEEREEAGDEEDEEFKSMERNLAGLREAMIGDEDD